MSDEEIKTVALSKHPHCSYAVIVNGMNAMFQITRVANLYRNEECYLADDPPREVVEGFPGYGK